MKEVKNILYLCQSWEEHKKVIESALFMAPGSLGSEDLAKLLGVKDQALVQRIVSELMEEYNSRNAGIEILPGENAWQMQVKPHYLERVKHLATKAELNKAVQRTLALIAVKEPVQQSLIIKYRNNKAYEHIKQLKEEGFIERQQSGKTYLLKTTEKFKQYFGNVKQPNSSP